jgi:L-seryl-tRNA(Ser) seleniumtransferase
MTTIDSVRQLPKVDELLREPRLENALRLIGHVPVREAIRTTLDKARESLLAGHPDEPITEESIIFSILKQLDRETKTKIRKVINATGAILHTNLGRAPLAEQALDAVMDCSRGYSSLEYDLEHSRRGQRSSSTEELLCRLFNVEAATVVNNNAAAVMLALSSLCRGREVIVSRGELVEIGGKFRVPEIMEESGAKLREVGTTNRTRISDYVRAVNESTAAFLKVHRSNFRMSGFVEEVDECDLAALARQHAIPLIYDLGSGCISQDLAELLPKEPTVSQAIACGAEVICFSGDKLLGGPQAGIIIGKKEYVERCQAHPLMRAFRCDKMTLSALQATLTLYLDPEMARQHIPLLQMALVDTDALFKRSEQVKEILNARGIKATVTSSNMIMGGGSAPEVRIPSWALTLVPENGGSLTLQSIESALRAYDPPIICRTVNNSLLFDLRTVSEREEQILIEALCAILKEGDKRL